MTPGQAATVVVIEAHFAALQAAGQLPPELLVWVRFLPLWQDPCCGVVWVVAASRN
jgi:hypothetical protein